MPQELQADDLNTSAFHPAQNYIQIQITDNKAHNIVIQSSSPLSVAFILRSLHDRLHSALSRGQYTYLSPQNQHLAEKSFRKRCAAWSGAGDGGLKILDIFGFGAKDVIFVGLKEGDGPNEWIPVFRTRR